MTMVCGLDLHRRQITFDALEVESGEVWTGQGVAARPGTLPTVAAPRRHRPRERRPGVDRRGGLHWLALRRRGGGRGRVRGAPRRAGRHSSGPWTQAARQDRPQRQPAVA